jgi:long-chain acyl-CoA synthetase
MDNSLTGRTIIQLQDFTMYNYKEGESPKIEEFTKFCTEHRSEIDEMKLPTIVAEDLASIIYTSGTTGNSKGVMLTHKNLLSNAIQGYNIFPINENYRCLSILPMSHTLEFTLGNIYPVMTGASIHYLKKPPTASILMPALKKVKPNLMLSVPLIMEKIYKSKIRPELTSSPIKRTLFNFAPTRKLLHKIAGKRLYSTFGGELKFFGIGGAKLDYDVERFLIEGKFPYAIGYGLTETSPLLAGKIPFKGKIGSTGLAVDGVELKLINKDPKTGEGAISNYFPFSCFWILVD